MKSNLLLKLLYNGVLFICALVITIYYCNSTTLNEILFVPMSVLIIALVYIILQIINRHYGGMRNWWDWTYYLGLLAMFFPSLMADEDSLQMYSFITDYGVLFLFMPIVMNVIQLLKK